MFSSKTPPLPAMQVRLNRVRRDERGQMAFLMVLSVLIVFMFFGFSFDAGLWYFDHRTAQNQADAAAHDAALELPLPAGNPAAAITAAQTSLTKSGTAPVSSCVTPPSGGGTLHSGMVFWDRSGDTTYDTIRVCVGRDTPAFFGGLAGIDSAHVSALATATVIQGSQPWAIFANDPCPSSDTLLFSGSNTVVVGAVHSDCHLTLSGSNNAFSGPVTYSPSPAVRSLSGSRHRRVSAPPPVLTN